MTPEEVVIVILKANAAVAAATGSGNRIWVERVPQGTTAWPGVLVNLIRVNPEKCQQGDGIDSVELMVSVIGASYSSAAGVADLLRGALDNKGPGLYTDVDDGSTLQVIGITMAGGGVEPEMDKGELYSRSMDVVMLVQR